MKTQTYIFFLLDDNGKKINFERWAYKRFSKCLACMQELLQWDGYKRDLEKCVTITAHKTDCNATAENIVFSVSKEAFFKI